MTTDLYSVVLFSDGEELTPGDLMSVQSQSRSTVTDQLLETLAPFIFIESGLSTQGAFPCDTDFWGQSGDEPRIYAYCIDPGGAFLRQGTAKNKISLGRGTLLQKIADQDGLTPSLIPFTFGSNTSSVSDLWTIADGDVADPRFDLLQMSLSYVDDTSVSRLTRTNPVKATLDFSSVTTNDNTTVRARVAGFGGNSVSVSMQKRSSGVGVSYSENGNAVAILYQNGVSTVADVEASIIANSSLLEINSTGTGVSVLHDPVDSFAATHLTSGVDSLIINPSINTKRRVQCTLTVKQGTPNPSPVQPTVDAGCCVVGIVLVGNGWTSVGNDLTLGTNVAIANNAVLMDERMPIGVRTYVADPTTFKLATAFSLTDSGCSVTASNATNDLYIPCPTSKGRLVGFSIYYGVNPFPNSGQRPRLGSFKGCTLASFEQTVGTRISTAHVGFIDSDEHFNLGDIGSGDNFYTFIGALFASDNTRCSLPLWANGYRCARPKFLLAGNVGTGGGTGGWGGPSVAVNLEQLAINLHNITNGTKIGRAVFYVAEGL